MEDQKVQMEDPVDSAILIENACKENNKINVFVFLILYIYDTVDKY
jgi:hypothetical protein